MLSSDRTEMISRTLRKLATTHPATIIFPGKAPVRGSRCNSAATASLRLGGFTASGPVVFLIDRALMPAGVEIAAQKTTFLADGTRYLVDSFDSQDGDPQIKITAILAGQA